MAEIAPTSTVNIQLKADMVRSDLTQGLVWFLNYAALDPEAVRSDDLDLHGTSMLPRDVEKFAHRWLAFCRSIDIEHDGVGRPVYAIESFFNSAEVNASAWPLNSHAVRLNVSSSKEALDGLRSGSLNSVSLDALTFNRVERLPVDQAQRSAPNAFGEAVPSTASNMALELAQMGYPGVVGVKTGPDGMYIAERSHGLPLAVHITDEFVEVTSAGGAWGHLAATLCTSGTLAFAAMSDAGVPDGHIPDHGGTMFVVDHTPWDPNEVQKLMSTYFDMTETSPYAWLRNEVGDGQLVHHVVKAGVEMVNVNAVRSALRNLDSVPVSARNAARRHLLQHLQDATV